MKLLKRILLALPGFAALCRHLTRGTPRVLMYHRFAPGDRRIPRRLPAAVLDRQLAYLRRHHRLWRAEELLAVLAGNAPPPTGCPVLLTIDDGYADAADVAAPLLTAHHASAVLFVTTGFVDGTTWFWWDRLRWLLDTARPRGRVTLTGRSFPVSGDSAAARQRLWNDLADALQSLPAARRERELDELAAALGVDLPSQPPPDYAPATWHRLRELDGGPLELAAHTVTHPILSHEDDATVAAELTGGKRRLEEILGREVPLFCYPSGMPQDIDERVVRLAAAAGYRAAFVAHPGGDPADPYRQPRWSAPADWTEFRWLLCGAALLVDRFRGRSARKERA